MNITVNINAPELASAIHALAQSLAGSQLAAPAAVPQSVSPSFNVPVHQPAPEVNQQNVVPFTQQPPGEQAVPNVPTATTPAAVPGSVPTTPASAPTAAPGSVPTTGAPTYTMDQLAVAATQLVDAGRQAEVVQLLASFGVQALTALPKEHYGAFATQLRAMGAKL